VRLIIVLYNNNLRLYEEKCALVSGEEGLDLIMEIIENLNKLLKQNGLLVIECNENHIE